MRVSSARACPRSSRELDEEPIPPTLAPHRPAPEVQRAIEGAEEHRAPAAVHGDRGGALILRVAGPEDRGRLAVGPDPLHEDVLAARAREGEPAEAHRALEGA